MITVRANELDENQLAQIALSIQGRWRVATFVKMHEIVIMDDEDYEEPEAISVRKDFERGLKSILEYLEMEQAFRIRKQGHSKFELERIEGSRLPSWVDETRGQRQAPPEGVYACPHCGRWLNSELEYSMHTKLHYII